MAYTKPGETRERVYRYVRDRLVAGEPPTVREVQEAMGFRAVESARTHLEALVEAGRLAKEPGSRSRGYRLPGGDDAEPPRLVPLLGRVQAGALTAAVEEPEGYLTGQHDPGPEGLFALRVQGDSMVGAGILEGDVVIVRRGVRTHEGDIVVALVGEEATVKRLRVQRPRRKRRGHRRERAAVVLVAENPAYPPIRLDPSEVTVLGKVVEVRRYLEGGPA